MTFRSFNSLVRFDALGGANRCRAVPHYTRSDGQWGGESGGSAKTQAARTGGAVRGCDQTFWQKGEIATEAQSTQRQKAPGTRKASHFSVFSVPLARRSCPQRSRLCGLPAIPSFTERSVCQETLSHPGRGSPRKCASNVHRMCTFREVSRPTECAPSAKSRAPPNRPRSPGIRMPGHARRPLRGRRRAGGGSRGDVHPMCTECAAFGRFSPRPASRIFAITFQYVGSYIAHPIPPRRRATHIRVHSAR